MKYPKIETLFKRDEDTFKVTPGDYRKEEFGMVNKWLVTEKVDGTNIRIQYNPTWDNFKIGGRTDNAQIPVYLYDYLMATFTNENLGVAFDKNTDATVTLFGEGYGVKIQKGGNYRPSGVSFRLFDIAVEGTTRVWWLRWEDLTDIADILGIETVPPLGIFSTEEAIKQVGAVSEVAHQEGGNMAYLQEGIVARTDPYLHMRSGQRVVWKLKRGDLV